MPHKTNKIGERLYCYIWQGRGNNCNTYLFAHVLRGGRPHIIVDPGSVVNELREDCYGSLVAAMQSDGIRPEDIGLVINTHTHPDHCHATEKIVEAGTREPAGKAGISGPLTALSRQEYDYFKSVGEKMFGMFGMPAPQLEPFIYLTEGDLILGKAGDSPEGGDGRIELKVILTPGHSPGSISLYWPEQRALITGDAVFFGSIGRTDFPGGSISTLKQSIDKLAALDVEYLLPGHSTEYGSIIAGRDMVRRNFSAIKLLV